MARKTVNKNNKKNEKKDYGFKNKETKRQKNDEVTKLVEMILVVLVIFAGFYIITSFITKKQSNTNSTENVSEDDKIIQYDEILIGNLFNQPNNEYYVLLTNDDSYYKDSLNYYSQSYNQKEDTIRLYTVDTNDLLNKSYIAEQSNINVENIKDFKVSTTTLILIKDKKIQKAIEGDIEVTKELIEISK